jgi:signal transduction histidine kinase
VAQTTTIPKELRPPSLSRLDSLERAIQSPLGDSERVMLLCEMVWEVYAVDGQRTKRYAEEASALAERIQSARCMAQAAWAMGLYYYQQNLYDRAMQKFVESTQSFERLGLAKDAGRCYTSIGNIHLRNAQYEKALSYYARAMEIAERFHDTLRIAINLSTRAQVFRKHYQDYNRAIADLQKAIVLFSAVGNLLRVGGNHSIIGDVLADQGDYVQALKQYHRALELRRQLTDNLGQTETLMGIAECYNALRRPREALPYIEEAVRLARQIGSIHIAAATHQTLAETLAALGQYREAYRYRAMAAQFSDTVFSKQRSEAIAEMQARYELDHKNAQLREQQQEVERQRFLRNVFVGGALILGLVALWMWWLYRGKYRAEREARTQHERAEAQATELLYTNQALEASNQRLREFDTEKNEFLGIVVHDLKNPLASILLSVDLQIRSFRSGNYEKVEEYADTVRATIERMMGIISNLLDLNRIERGGWAMNIRAVELELVDAVVEMYRSRAAQKHICLHLQHTIDSTSCSSSTPMLLADYEATRHVLDNLLSNAVKYSPSGKNIWVHVSSIYADDDDINQTTNAGRIRIEIRDEGPGLSAEDKQKLFGKFARLSARPTAGEHSTGLGLSIVKKLVEAMNGRVWCESELGNGATFIVELPSVMLLSTMNSEQERLSEL